MKRLDPFYNSIMHKFGFVLHKRFSMHMLILLIMNLISGFTIVGLFSLIKNPVINYRVVDFIVFIIVVTVVELIVKTLMVRYFIKWILRSFGILTLIVQGLIFWLSSLMIERLNFIEPVVLNLFFYTLSFLFLRLALISIYQKYIVNKFMREK